MRWRNRLLLLSSLLFLLGTIFIWLWSRFLWPDATGLALGARYHRQFDMIVGISGPRDVWYHRTIIPWPLKDPIGNADRISPNGRRPNGLLGFSMTGYFPNSRDWYVCVGLPFWFCAGIGILGIARAWVRLRASPMRPGYCPVCDYDLRATPDRCPECGHVVRDDKKH